MFFMCFVLLVLGADFFLAEIVHNMRENHKFELSLTDFSTNITEGVMKQLQQYDTKMEFSPAERTSSKSYLGKYIVEFNGHYHERKIIGQTEL